MNSGPQTPDMHNHWHDLVPSPACENLALALQHRAYVGVHGSVSLLCWVSVSPEGIVGVWKQQN